MQAPCRRMRPRSPVNRDRAHDIYDGPNQGAILYPPLYNMKCAVAIVLALIGMVVANPVSPLGYGHGYGYGYGSSLLLPSAVSVSSSVVNHGLSYPKVVAPIVTTPIITAPIIKTVAHAPIVAPISLGWGGYGGYGLGYGGYGLGHGGYGLGYGSYGLAHGGYGLGHGLGYGGWGGLGWGKGWH